MCYYLLLVYLSVCLFGYVTNDEKSLCVMGTQHVVFGVQLSNSDRGGSPSTSDNWRQHSFDQGKMEEAMQWLFYCVVRYTKPHLLYKLWHKFKEQVPLCVVWTHFHCCLVHENAPEDLWHRTIWKSSRELFGKGQPLHYFTSISG